jgi:hypothetical protein
MMVSGCMPMSCHFYRILINKIKFLVPNRIDSAVANGPEKKRKESGGAERKGGGMERNYGFTTTL